MRCSSICWAERLEAGLTWKIGDSNRGASRSGPLKPIAQPNTSGGLARSSGPLRAARRASVAEQYDGLSLLSGQTRCCELTCTDVPTSSDLTVFQGRLWPIHVMRRRPQRPSRYECQLGLSQVWSVARVRTCNIEVCLGHPFRGRVRFG